jgi:predicted  nucleic acid-binding Zn-ribbon protein
MYGAMNDEEMIPMLEDNHKWVYKLSKQADLDKMGSDHTDAQADGRRATKQDIVKLKKENSEMKKEIVEVRSSLERMEKEMKSSIKSGVESILLALPAERK